tara:strand:+ start:821 stop:1360 length:540 start_codon:yes stop_codon:yes gene_type:complete
MKSILNKFGTVLFIVFFLFIGIKGCVHTIYSATEVAIYENIDSNKESTKIYIIPSNLMIIKKQYNSQYEYAVFNLKGTNATHYFGALYNKGENLLGVRIFTNANEVWKLEMKIKNKKGNLNESVFHEIGTTYRNTLIVRDNSISLLNDYSTKLGGFEYKKIKLSNVDIEFLNQVKEKVK